MFDPDQIDEPLLRRCHDYWQAKGAAERLPARRDIEPGEMLGFLSNVVLVDTAPRLEDFRFRLWGTGVTQGFGEDRTGLRFSELGEIENLEESLHGYWHSACAAAAHYSSLRPVRSNTVQGYARIVLPLSRDGEAIDMLLACFEFAYHHEPRPNRAL